MSEIAAPAPVRAFPKRSFVVVGAVLALAFAARLTGIAEGPSVSTFVLISTSIVVEALPFVLLGAAVSAAIATFVPDSVFDRFGRLPSFVQIPCAALGGLAFPVCECGSIPVARRLIARGMDPAAGIAFMLAAPVINPVVLLSTWFAYSGRGLGLQMVIGRAILGLAVALVVGWAFGSVSVVRNSPSAIEEHGHGSRSAAFLEHLSADFFFMGRFVVMGGVLAAAIQLVIPSSIVSSVADQRIVGILALMGWAFLLSLCSEADAFVAVSFVAFPVGAQLAFLTFGPIADIKLAFLYGATFKRDFVPKLLAVSVPTIVVGSLWFEGLVR